MSLQDGIFAEQVENDITLFSKDARRKRVLVFPPVNNYRRFLIHQLVQESFGDLLKTFSIGQDLARRTVVCYQSDLTRDRKLNGVPSRGNVESTNSSRLDSTCAAMGGEERRSPPSSPEHLRLRQVKSAPAVEIYRPPAARRAGKNGPVAPSAAVPAVADSSTSSSSASVKANRNRRPDRAVYVPKHRRSEESNDVAQISELSDSRKKTSSPSRNVNGNGQARASFNKDDSIGHSSTSSSCFTEFSSKNDKNEDENSERDLSNAGQLFISEEEEFDDNNKRDSRAKETKIRPATSRVSSEFASRSSSASSDAEPIICVSSEISRDRSSSDDLASNDARTNSDLEIVTENRDKKRDRESCERDERLNNKSLGNFGSCIVSNVLIISDRKETPKFKNKTENVVVGVCEKEVTPVKSPEKKLKKVARAKSKPASPPAPPVKLNRDECDWDSLFDDNGECLDPTLIEELTAAVGDVTIEAPRNDYKAFSRPVEVSNDEFGHVVEIYNFPSDFKTSDLAAVFSPWKNGGFELKWVDDTHCLGVFSSPLVASEVLSSDHPFVKTRPLSAATALSKTKARKSAEFLQPYKSRPETCAALARRLVTGALGVKLATARQEREQEKAVLREAKEKRRLANKQREDVWEGIIAEK